MQHEKKCEFALAKKEETAAVEAAAAATVAAAVARRTSARKGSKQARGVKGSKGSKALLSTVRFNKGRAVAHPIRILRQGTVPYCVLHASGTNRKLCYHPFTPHNIEAPVEPTLTSFRTPLKTPVETTRF